MELKGATIWLRKTIESDVFYWKPDKWFKIWFFLINKVNHQDTKLFKRGSNFTTYQEISLYTKATRHQIDQFIRWAKKEQMLTTQKTTRGMIVFIDKYEECQDYIKTKNDTEHETKTKHKRNINDTINNNVKNDNNEKNEKKGLFVPPSLSELKEYIALNEYNVDPEQWLNFYESKGWLIGKVKMKNWKAAVRTWAGRNKYLPKIDEKEQEARALVEECRAQFGNDAEEVAMFRFSKKYGKGSEMKYKGIFHL